MSMIPLGLYGAARPAPWVGGFAYIGGGAFTDFGVTTTAKIQTLTAVPLGADFAGRQIAIVVMMATDSTAGNIGSVVVGGVTFTIDVTSGVTRSVVGVARGVVAGTSADVVITAGGSTNKAYTSSAIAVYSLPPDVTPAYSFGAGGTAAAMLTSVSGGTSVVGITRTTDPVAGLSAPLTTDYNQSGIRLAGHVLDYDGAFDMAPNYAGNSAYNRVAGVTYA